VCLPPKRALVPDYKTPPPPPSPFHLQREFSALPLRPPIRSFGMFCLFQAYLPSSKAFHLLRATELRFFLLPVDSRLFLTLVSILLRQMFAFLDSVHVLNRVYSLFTLLQSLFLFVIF